MKDNNVFVQRVSEALSNTIICLQASVNNCVSCSKSTTGFSAKHWYYITTIIVSVPTISQHILIF